MPTTSGDRPPASEKTKVSAPSEDEDDAVRISNDSDHGLHGSVFSTDEKRALALAARPRTGNVAINCGGLAFNVPFGDYKKSGIGREFGPEGLLAYLETKSVYTANPR